MYQRGRRGEPDRGAARTGRRVTGAPPPAGAALASMIGNRAMARFARAQQARPGARNAAPAREAEPRTGGGRQRVLARDLTKPHNVWHGRFQMSMKTSGNPGAKSGLDGTISFTPDRDTPDSKTIKLFQAGRQVDLDTGKEAVWTDDFASRMEMETVADAKKGIEPGWAIDIDLKKARKRTAESDEQVSPYYRDYYPNKDDSHDGSKKGASIVDASLSDFPGSTSTKSRFSFETVAVSVDTGMVYGTVQWGFTVSDPAKGTVDSEHSAGRAAPTASTMQALKNFNEYFGNRGATTAPRKSKLPDWKP